MDDVSGEFLEEEKVTRLARSESEIGSQVFDDQGRDSKFKVTQGENVVKVVDTALSGRSLG